jgi:NAD(P)-dependent dehydrogenase (short-subunit alcohol dehydrogenase family)
VDLQKKVVIVTGGASGIGEACAIAFADAGAKVLIADLNDRLGTDVARSLIDRGKEAEFLPTDVTDEHAISKMVDRAVEIFGGLDGAVNAAGIPPNAMPIQDVTAEELRRNFDTMLFGIGLCMKYEVRALLARGAGSIVNISSAGGLYGVASLGAYIATKHGVVGITRSAALELATKGVRVNAICPGMIDTPQYHGLKTSGQDWSAITKSCPMKRFGEPSEVADVALWLLSQRSSYVTGQAIAVDGGLTAGPMFDR